jgi:hypothetical protein
MKGAEEIPYVCKTCGTQFAPSVHPPPHCFICEDERQYVGHQGQQWTTLDLLTRDHQNSFQTEEPGLSSLVTEPHFAIGQQAFVVQTPEGNLLWDCLAVIDERTIATVRSLGGIRAIAISHPHYYTTMVEWSRVFGHAPIHLHEADRSWVMRPDDSIHFWAGERMSLFGGIRLIRTRGHFEGFQVAHWPDGAHGRGVLLAGDQPQVCADRNWVTFMYSYPNYIPLGMRGVDQIRNALEDLPFERLYGAFRDGNVRAGAKQVVERSASRFLHAISSL